jgi:hypothetical protein
MLVVGLPSGAFAQAAPAPRPYQGIFGGGDTNPVMHHKLDLALSVVGAYDDDVLPGVTGGIDPSTRPFNGYNTTYAGSVAYTWQGRKVQAGVSGTSAFRHYTEFHDYNMTHAAAAGVSAQFARRTTLFVNQTAEYSPPYLFGLFPTLDPERPGGIVSGGPNYLINDTESLTYTTIASVEHGLTRRDSLVVSGDYRYTDFLKNVTGRVDVKSKGARAGYARNLARDTTFTAGYHYRTGQLGFGSVAVTTDQGVDVGVQYTKRLSRTRRAQFTFSVGSSTMDLPFEQDSPILPGRHSSVTADAALNYSFARTWLVRGAYRRGAEFVVELTNPVFADSVISALIGKLTRNLRLLSTAGYSSGQSFQLSNPALTTYTGNLQLAYQINDSISSYVEYLYYYYDIGHPAELAPGLLTGIERNGVRAGLTLTFSMRRR